MKFFKLIIIFIFILFCAVNISSNYIKISISFGEGGYEGYRAELLNNDGTEYDILHKSENNNKTFSSENYIVYYNIPFDHIKNKIAVKIVKPENTKGSFYINEKESEYSIVDSQSIKINTSNIKNDNINIEVSLTVVHDKCMLGLPPGLINNQYFLFDENYKFIPYETVPQNQYVLLFNNKNYEKVILQKIENTNTVNTGNVSEYSIDKEQLNDLEVIMKNTGFTVKNICIFTLENNYNFKIIEIFNNSNQLLFSITKKGNLYIINNEFTTSIIKLPLNNYEVFNPEPFFYRKDKGAKIYISADYIYANDNFVSPAMLENSIKEEKTLLTEEKEKRIVEEKRELGIFKKKYNTSLFLISFGSSLMTCSFSFGICSGVLYGLLNSYNTNLYSGTYEYDIKSKLFTEYNNIGSAVIATFVISMTSSLGVIPFIIGVINLYKLLKINRNKKTSFNFDYKNEKFIFFVSYKL